MIEIGIARRDRARYDGGMALEELFKFPARRVVAVVFLLVAAFCPGMLAILVYAPDFFERVELFKLLAISAGISIPILASNCGFVVRSMGKDPSRPVEMQAVECVMMGSFWAILVMYAPILWELIAGWGGIRTGILIVIIVQVIIERAHKFTDDVNKGVNSPTPPTFDV